MPFIGKKKCLSGEKTIFRLLSQSLKYNNWRTAPETKEFQRQKKSTAWWKPHASYPEVKKNGHKFFREFTKIICFSNYSASKFWDPQSHLLVKVAKTGFGFHNNFFQVILFSERDSMIDFLLISHQKRFGNFPRKGIVRVQTGKLVTIVSLT